MDKPVFFISAFVLVVVVVACVAFPDASSRLFAEIQTGIVANASWYYVLVVAVILVSSVVISLTRFG